MKSVKWSWVSNIWFIVSFVFGVLSVCVAGCSQWVSWLFLEGAAVAGFLGWFMVKSGEFKKLGDDGFKVFFFYQVLGSMGLLSYMLSFFGGSLVGYLSLVGGLGLKMGASLIFPSWVLGVSESLEEDEDIFAFTLVMVLSKIAPLGWLMVFAGSEKWWGSSAIWALGSLSLMWGVRVMYAATYNFILPGNQPSKKEGVRSLAWLSCVGVSWLFVGVGSGSLVLLAFCCIVYLYGIGAKLGCWRGVSSGVKFGHFLIGCFLKLLIVFWMFYVLFLTSSTGLFSVFVVIGYALGLCGEMLYGEFKDKFYLG